MLKSIPLALAFLFGLITSPALAAEPSYIVAEIPIYAQKLRFKLPRTWQHANTDESENYFRVEFTPINQAIDQSQNQFSIQGHKNFNPAATTQNVANSVANNFASICPDSTFRTDLGARVLDGQNAFLSVMGCTNIPADHPTGLKAGMSEISYYVFVIGKSDLYIAQKSIRGQGFTGGQLPANVEAAMAEMKNFFPIEFCTLESPQGRCEK